MNRLELRLNTPGARYFPGDAVEGTLSWELERDPARLEIALFWSTEGKGSTDSHTVATELIEQPGQLGTREFRFTLPEAPHSFSGKLISLVWGVEALCKKPKVQEFVPLVMSPTGGVLTLGEPEEEDVLVPAFVKKFKQ